jgi:SAM-dependent methyltransferase
MSECTAGRIIPAVSTTGIDWDEAADGWSKRADGIRELGMPVSAWMIDAAALHPGARLLELACGPGDTGFLAAELIQPGGTLMSSDSSERMLDVARARAAAQGIDNVEFRALMLEWIDLPAASVDVILCRWGLMLVDDPAAAAKECRRVLAPGGRFTLAVWNNPALNPWATVPTESLVALGHAEPPDRSAPGMFALADTERLDDLLADAGFVERRIEPVALERVYESLGEWLAETLDLSVPFGRAWEQLSDEQRTALTDQIRERAAPFTGVDGSVRLPGSSLAAVAS